MMGIDTHAMWRPAVKIIWQVDAGRASRSNSMLGEFSKPQGTPQLFELEEVYARRAPSIDWAIATIAGRKADGARRNFSGPVVAAFACVHECLQSEAVRSAEKLLTQVSDRADCPMKKVRALVMSQVKVGDDGRWLLFRQTLRCLKADADDEGLSFMQKAGPDIGLDWLLGLRAKRR